MGLSLGGILFLFEAFLERGDHLHKPAIRTSQPCTLSPHFCDNVKLALPEYVQPVQGCVCARVPCKDGARETVAHLEERPVELIRLMCGGIRGEGETH